MARSEVTRMDLPHCETRSDDNARRFAIGVGARRGVDARALADLVARVAHDAKVSLRICEMFTLQGKEDEAGLYEAASLLGTKLTFLPLEALLARKDELLTKSSRVEAMTGVGSVAEAAALSGAGPRSMLIAPRTATERLTCAIARGSMENAAP
jgi:cobalt-precorrin 5A hydrolase